RLDLVVRCQSDPLNKSNYKLEAFIALGVGYTTTASGHPIDYKIDNLKPGKLQTNRSDAFDGYFIQGAPKLIRELIGKNEIIMEVRTYRGLLTPTFKIAGLKEKLSAIEPLCGVDLLGKKKD